MEQAVARGEFREDLYYRLNVVTIALPALRDRKQDIPALVQHFLKRSRGTVSMTPSALPTLCEHHWPGNVRELGNPIARALVLARSRVMDRDDILLLDDRQGKGGKTLDRSYSTAKRLEREFRAARAGLVERASTAAQGNKSKAADILGIHRRLLYEKLGQYAIKRTPESGRVIDLCQRRALSSQHALTPGLG